MSVAIGIDLGTTNTAVAAVVDGVAVTLEDEQARRLLPSVVSFHPSGTVLVGEAARERRLIDPENTIFSIKPLLGRPWDSDEVRGAKMRFPFQLAEGTKNSTMVMARDVAYALPEISAFVLRRAKAIAEARLGQQVDRAVITVPANFNDLQRAATKIAGKLAGLEVMRILNEPTAAALAYGQSIAKAEKIAVYDLGGGTFDITLLDLTGNVFEVLATSGDTALGGDDLDRLLAEKMALEVIKKFNVDPRTDPVAFARLRFLAEEVKKELSTAHQTTREVSGIGYTAGGQPITMSLTITREELERVALPLVERTISVARQSIEIIGLNTKDFDRVILVGGSTRMPMVGRMVEQLFGQPPHLKVNPDEVVALGAAIQAHALNRSKAAHKRKSGHDQLAAAQPSGPQAKGDQLASQPPTANPNPIPAVKVPPAAALPKGMDVPPPPAGVFSFEKPAPVITFSPAPPAPAASAAPAAAAADKTAIMKGAPPKPPAAAAKPPPVPAKKPPAPPPVPQKTAVSRKPIEGTPVRAALSEPPPGPKPRRSNRPGAADGPSGTAIMRAPNVVPDLALDEPGTSGPPPVLAPPPPPPLPAAASAPAPATRTESSSANLGAIVSAGDFFPDLAPAKTEAFERGSAIETSDKAPLLIDVTPLSLRVETVGGYADVLIQANTPVPCEKTRAFLTASDGQTMVFIRVAQGESTRFAENTYLGELELSGLKPARRGEVAIIVTFELDADGLLNVRAKDKETGHETKATMKISGQAADPAEMAAMEARQARAVMA